MQTIHPKSKEEWRKWLEKNHLKEVKVCLLKHKKHTGKPTITNPEAMREAICFGWIDTTVKRIDEDTYCQFFAKRNHNSRWSNNTLRYAKELIKEKKMAPQGLKMYKEGLQKPTLDEDVPHTPEIQKELKVALEKNKEAAEKFDRLPPSRRKVYLRWIEKAKRDETRMKRVAMLVDALTKDKKLF
ncbi:hypothetical protein COV20_04780 [Candidatus Woesearchaeota archaeon CG10_big_fil_rev_8_21_14_0_10_45_16]|nr:MAG: hypothetical protein COV20_04780 [Candidatus Woesearchaeota archaeon CG10_big_fil_rev_8_21_14_0_10_45_16]